MLGFENGADIYSLDGNVTPSFAFVSRGPTRFLMLFCPEKNIFLLLSFSVVAFNVFDDLQSISFSRLGALRSGELFCQCCYSAFKFHFGVNGFLRSEAKEQK